ncbi:metallophosphoesterase family protein [Rhizobium sp. LjRoot258]|uniref:metallophosphoesterase family protein n=1 Tax=Rhizobium sp. LjRoot258 TaxID=3342299 RepID=UPI003ED05545
MSSFRFIHAADLHLGSPMLGLASKDADVAAQFIEATRNALSTLVSKAIDLAVDFIVIAGDIYDGDWKDNKIGLFFNREMARLQRAGIPVYLLRGNHDAVSVVTKTITLPDNVFEFPTNRPGTFRIDRLKVALHGQGFAERSATENLAIGYRRREQGWFNIGVLHTSLSGREPHAPYAPCSVDDLRSRGYDYWALGHVHQFEEVSADPLVIFAGNLQGRSVREVGAKGAVLVTVGDSHVEYERIIVDGARFCEVKAMLEPHHSMIDILQIVERAGRTCADEGEGRPLAVRVRLSGHSELQSNFVVNRHQWRDEIQASLHRAHENIWLEKLEVRLSTGLQEKPSGDAHAGLDLRELVRLSDDRKELLLEAQALISSIAIKLPGGAAADESPLEMSAEALLEEAKQLLFARTEMGL